MFAACSLLVVIAWAGSTGAAPQDPPNGTIVVRGATVHTGTPELWRGDLEARHGRFVVAGTVQATNAELKFGGPTRTTGTVSAIARSWVGTVNETECKQLIWKDDGTIWQS